MNGNARWRWILAAAPPSQSGDGQPELGSPTTRAAAGRRMRGDVDVSWRWAVRARRRRVALGACATGQATEQSLTATPASPTPSRNRSERPPPWPPDAWGSWVTNQNRGQHKFETCSLAAIASTPGALQPGSWINRTFVARREPIHTSTPDRRLAVTQRQMGSSLQHSSPFGGKYQLITKPWAAGN